MDSEDDMHDANNMESLDDDDFYSVDNHDGALDYYSDYDDDVGDYFDDADKIESCRPEVSLNLFFLIIILV